MPALLAYNLVNYALGADDVESVGSRWNAGGVPTARGGVEDEPCALVFRTPHGLSEPDGRSDRAPRRIITMATRADVQRIALSLPGAEQGIDHFAFGIRRKRRLKGFAWVWMERVDPKRARVPNPRVLAVRVATLMEKERLLSEFPKALFTEPHYEGFPAVLVRLDVVPIPLLRQLVTEGWRCMATADQKLGGPKPVMPRRRRARLREE